MLRSAWRRCAFLRHESHRPFSIIPALLDKPLPRRRVIEEHEITEAFLKGSGPGGQKINKTSSAVQIKHIETGIVVKCQGTRSREQNRKDARRMLAEKLDDMEKGDQSRTAIKTERARVKKASSNKKSRRKYKLLADEKAAEETGGEDEDGSASEENLAMANAGLASDGSSSAGETRVGMNDKK